MKKLLFLLLLALAAFTAPAQLPKINTTAPINLTWVQDTNGVTFMFDHADLINYGGSNICNYVYIRDASVTNMGFYKVARPCEVGSNVMKANWKYQTYCDASCFINALFLDGIATHTFEFWAMLNDGTIFYKAVQITLTPPPSVTGVATPPPAAPVVKKKTGGPHQ